MQGMRKIRCPHCNALLFKAHRRAVSAGVEIKCRRCGLICPSAPSALTMKRRAPPERLFRGAQKMGREWIYECDKKGEKQLVGYVESAFYVRKIPRAKAALAALHPASTVLRVFTPTLLPVAVRATITPFTQATQNAVRTELTTAFHSAPSPGKALPLSVISTAFARVEGLGPLLSTAQPRNPPQGCCPCWANSPWGAANG